MLGSPHFQTYHKTLYRVRFADLVGDHLEANRGRLLSIVGTSAAHERWLEERRANPPQSLTRPAHAAA
jgi:hypothetical protein